MSVTSERFAPTLRAPTVRCCDGLGGSDGPDPRGEGTLQLGHDGFPEEQVGVTDRG